MNVLAIEYSSAQRSIAVLRADEDGRVWASGEAVETGGRAAHSTTLTDEALSSANLEREQIEVLAVGLGPGSYTGIRSAISFAQGWQLAAGARFRIVGIPSTDCLVAEAVSRNFSGKAAIAIDAQRGEVYLADYEFGEGAARETAPLRIASLKEADALQLSGTVLFGPEEIRGLSALRIVPCRALALAQLALARKDFVSAAELAPVYLRETTFVKAPPPRQIG